MPRFFAGLLAAALTALVPRAALACDAPTSTSISATDSTLSDWTSSNLCMWQGTDTSGDAAAGADILGFGVTHTDSVADDPNHFWFIRLGGEPIKQDTYRLEFVQPDGTTVHMNMECPNKGDPQTCFMECTLNGLPTGCAATAITAYSLPNGEWVIELARQSTQLFFDSTDGATVTASTLGRWGNTLDSSEPIADYATNDYVTATAVLLARFSSHPAQDEGVELRWETASELGTLGFHVRRGGPDGPRINAELIQGQLTSPVGAHYALRDPLGTPATTYFLEELSLEGNHFYGLAKRSGEPAPAAVEKRGRVLAPHHKAGQGPSGPPSWAMTGQRPGRDVDEAFAEVRREGIYRITPAELAPNTPPHFMRFRLRHAGVAVPTFVTPEDDVLFYAPEPHSPERTYDAYRFSRDVPPRRGHRVRVVPCPVEDVAASFESTVRAEQHHVLDVAAEADRRFLWGYAFSGLPGKDFGFELPDYLGGPVVVTLGLVGMSNFDQPLTHHAVIEVNGRAAIDATFGGIGPVSYSVTLPDGVLLPGANVVTLSAIADLGVPWDLIGLSSIDATYSRAYRAVDDALGFSATASSGVEISGFTSEPMVFDVTDPAAPMQVVGFGVLRGPEGISVRFRAHPSSSGTRRYYAAVPRTPLLRASRANEVPAQGGDYVAIVGEGLSEALEPLLARRRADGRHVVSVPVEALYDKFDHGHHGPQAIRNYLAQLDPAPRDVLLVGKPSADPHDYLGHGVPDLLPAPFVVTGDMKVYSHSDALLVAGPDGRTPFAAIGRLPVLTAPELEAWVQKLLAYETSRGAPSGKALFVADDKDSATNQPDPLFQQLSEKLAGELAPMQPLKVYLPGQAKPELFAALSQAPDLVAYHGHGGGQYWAPRLLSSQDLPSLPEARPFLLVTVDCWDGMFAMPTFAPLSQALAQVPQGGAIAAFAAASHVGRTNHLLVDEAIFPHLADPSVTTVGDFTRRAQSSLARLVGPAHSLVFVYNLIGDPATPLPLR